MEQRSQQPGFWNNNEAAQAVMRDISALKQWIEPWQSLNKKVQDASELLALAEEENDEQTMQEIAGELEAIEKAFGDLEFRTMLSDRDDSKSAILTIHPGAGGTESQDWAQMLMRMYLRWAEKSQFEVDIMDIQDGEEAGIKSATLEITGAFAYGFLKAEAGVHRLVRISPFDFNKRRHTSFASVFVYPEVQENLEIEVDPNDLRIDTYRASGAGGQHVNKTSSAVRITHIPTGIVVQCQTERSQHRNRDSAMKILLSRLYQKKMEEENAKKAEIESKKMDIAFGSQIRSYVFQPYSLVKDHRTNFETGNVQAVMDGELDGFMRAFLMNNRLVK